MTKNQLYGIYFDNLYHLLRQKYRNIKCEKFGTKDYERIAEASQEAAHALFSYNQEILLYMNWRESDSLDATTNTLAKDGPVYKCSLDTDKNIFPYISLYQYRNLDIPEFLDDYGMDTFLEFKIGNLKLQHITTLADWDFEIDRLLDIEYLFNINDSIEEVKNKLDSFWELPQYKPYTFIKYSIE